MSLKLYLVSCDLLDRQGDYRSFREKLRTMGAAQVMDTQWALRSTFTAGELKNLLKQFLAASDRIVVSEVGAEVASRHAKVDLTAL